MPVVTYDRQRRQLQAPDLRHWLWARAMQTSHRVMGLVDHVGITRVHQLLNRMFRPVGQTVITEAGIKFRFPSADYYWNRLLDATYLYEPELDQLMARHAKLPFVFLDLGANFGYWTARASSGRYGQHLTLAVEPAEQCLSILRGNIGSGGPVHVYPNAIDEESGRRLNLYGHRHAGMSIDSGWYGASEKVANQVETITIDDLLEREQIDPVTTPLIIKLDVEAVELRALKGASRAIAGQSVIYIEDADAGEASAALRYLVDKNSCVLFYFENGRLRQLTSYAEIAALKRRLARWHAHALNLFATSSAFWREALGGQDIRLT
jgi:FkbM family methyltransferase